MRNPHGDLHNEWIRKSSLLDKRFEDYVSTSSSYAAVTAILFGDLSEKMMITDHLVVNAKKRLDEFKSHVDDLSDSERFYLFGLGVGRYVGLDLIAAIYESMVLVHEDLMTTFLVTMLGQQRLARSQLEVVDELRSDYQTFQMYNARAQIPWTRRDRIRNLKNVEHSLWVLDSFVGDLKSYRRFSVDHMKEVGESSLATEILSVALITGIDRIMRSRYRRR